MGPLTALIVSTVAQAGVSFELPSSEGLEAWRPVLETVDMVPGPAAAAPWARLSLEGSRCELTVATSWGATIHESVRCPASATDREEIAFLAAVMLEQVVSGRVPLRAAPTPSAPVTPAAPPPPSFTIDLSSAPVPAPRPHDSLVAGASDAVSPPSDLQLDAGVVSPAAAAALPSAPPGTELTLALCHATGCSVAFNPRDCAENGGCSTRQKCPETRWFDKDHDGWGDHRARCLDIDPEQAMGSWVQVIGDCDDDHSSIHPGAPEIRGDGIDNDCDGVAQ